MELAKVQIKKLNDLAIIPSYAKDGDAGCDLVATEAFILKANGGRAVIPTGLSLALPYGYVGFVAPRSGLAAKHGITCVNSPGIIDSGFRGEICVILANTDPNEDFEVNIGDRIAQLVIQKFEQVEWIELDEDQELPNSERGTGGFGSTGINVQ